MQVVITPKAQKHFKSLPQNEQTKIKKKLKLLEQDPYLGKKLSGALDELRSARAWPYRIIYFMETKEKRVYVVSILHRQGVYK